MLAITTTKSTKHVRVFLWTPGQSCLSSLIAYMKSSSGLADRQLETVLGAMQLPFPELTVLSLTFTPKRATPPIIPVSFTGGLPHLLVLGLSGVPLPRWPKLLLSATHLLSTFLISLIPGTFHPRQWPLSSLYCPASEYVTFDSNRLNLALTGKAAVHLYQSVLSFPLSNIVISKGLSNI